jgi:hypothetical protein
MHAKKPQHFLSLFLTGKLCRKKRGGGEPLHVRFQEEEKPLNVTTLDH